MWNLLRNLKLYAVLAVYIVIALFERKRKRK